MLIPSRLIRGSLRAALATLALTVVAENVAFAQCEPPSVVRPATAEEQKLRAEAFAEFQKTPPPAPAGWTASDGDSTAVVKEVCARPGEIYLLASFERNYTRTGPEVQARQLEAQRKVGAMMQENLAAVKAGKAVDFDAFDVAAKKITAEAERDTLARFRFIRGGNNPSLGDFSPFTVPAGKGYRRVMTENGVTTAEVIVVISPVAPARGLTVMFFEGDPARVDAMIKAASFR